MKTALQLQMGQTLHLTPQLLQSIRLLHLPALELEQQVRQALEHNVMLEREEAEEASPPAEAPPADGDAATEWDSAVEILGGTPPLEDEEGFEARRSAPEVRDARLRILAQLQLTLSDATDLRIGEILVDHVSDAGYLEAPFQEVALSVQAQVPATSARILAVLHHLQRLDPPGYGASGLRECLLIQLEALGPNTPGRTLAMRIVDEHLDALAGHDDAALAAALRAEPAAVARAARLIRSLAPKPGAAGGDDAAEYAVPDVIIRRAAGGWRAELNPATAPRVRINALYEQLLNRCKSEDGARSLREQLQEARWLVRGLSMRNDTLLRVARVIVERQRGFLERGDEAMKPLTLREVATAIGMHESTVSRVTTSKYAQTPRGVFELKHFFACSLAEGNGASGTAVRAMVRRLIESENPGRPLADGVIARLLERQGVHIARRTVTKYREAMAIAPARERLIAPAPGGAAGDEGERSC
jgi:RNA polymerase sigma-54 factor